MHDGNFSTVYHYCVRLAIFAEERAVRVRDVSCPKRFAPISDRQENKLTMSERMEAKITGEITRELMAN